MSHAEKLAVLEEVLFLDPGTLKGTENLKELASWDSMAVLSFMSAADEKCQATVAPDAIAACKTVDNLLELLP
jgi:acyl carrier protein